MNEEFAIDATPQSTITNPDALVTAVETEATVDRLQPIYKPVSPFVEIAGRRVDVRDVVSQLQPGQEISVTTIKQLLREKLNFPATTYGESVVVDQIKYFAALEAAQPDKRYQTFVAAIDPGELVTLADKDQPTADAYTPINQFDIITPPVPNIYDHQNAVTVPRDRAQAVIAENPSWVITHEYSLLVEPEVQVTAGENNLDPIVQAKLERMLQQATLAAGKEQAGIDIIAKNLGTHDTSLIRTEITAQAPGANEDASGLGNFIITLHINENTPNHQIVLVAWSNTDPKFRFNKLRNPSIYPPVRGTERDAWEYNIQLEAQDARKYVSLCLRTLVANTTANGYSRLFNLIGTYLSQERAAKGKAPNASMPVEPA